MESTIRKGKIQVIDETIKHKKHEQEANEEIVEETTAQEAKPSKHALFDNIIHKAKHQRINR